MEQYTCCSKDMNDYNTVYVYKIHFTRNISSNLLIYSTDLKIINDFNTILSYFYPLMRYFFSNIDVDSSRMTHKRSQEVGSGWNDYKKEATLWGH
jgi:hypothetical protein